LFVALSCETAANFEGGFDISNFRVDIADMGTTLMVLICGTREKQAMNRTDPEGNARKTSKVQQERRKSDMVRSLTACYN